MPWTVTYVQDTDAAGVGTCIAKYTPAAGESFAPAEHGRRLDTRDNKDIQAFMREANAVLQKRADDDSAAQVVVAKVEAVLNARK